MMTIDEAVLNVPGKTGYMELPALPQTCGRAGMFAGVSHNRLFCMGGTDFPSGYPWEGGKKKWHQEIFMLTDRDDKWVKLTQGLPGNLAYGVSASYEDKIILVGGNDAASHSAETWALEWKGDNLEIQAYPALPHPLANMAGSLVGHLLIVAGGMASPQAAPLLACYALDLDNLSKGWAALPAWPGPERVFPVCGAYKGKFYLFSGENAVENSLGIKQRNILQDAFLFTPENKQGRWTGVWTRLASMPKGMSAGASPAPLVNDKVFRFWGGVDRMTALYGMPETHPGIPGEVLWYDPETDTWEYNPDDLLVPGRVTLPTAVYKNYTFYIGGETRPGTRTGEVTGVINQVKKK